MMSVSNWSLDGTTLLAYIEVEEMIRTHTRSSPEYDRPTVSYNHSTIIMGDEEGDEGRIGMSAMPQGTITQDITAILPMCPAGGNSLWCEMCEMWVRIAMYPTHLAGRIHRARAKRSILHLASGSPYAQVHCKFCNLWFHAHRLRKHVRTAEHAEFVSFRAWQEQTGGNTMADFRRYLQDTLHLSP